MKLRENITVSMKYNLLLVLISLTGACTVLFATSHYGAGISPDSIGYIATARNLADGIGFVTYDDTPLLVQPPLYPAVLGVVDFVSGVDPLTSAAFVSAIFFGLALYFSGMLFFRVLFPLFAFFGLASLLVSIPLTRVALMAWSEPPFVFFVALYLFAISTYFNKSNGTHLSILALSVALACLTRYIGVVLVVMGVVGILMTKHRNLYTKLLHSALFAFLSTLPISVWIGRNYLLSNTLSGPRTPSVSSLFDNIVYTFDGILLWYLPSRLINISSVRMIILLIGAFLVGVIFYRANTPVVALFKQVRPIVVFSLLLAFGYAGFLIASSTTTSYDAIGSRLLAPIVIPVTLLLFVGLEMLSIQLRSYFPRKPVRFFLSIGLLIWLIYPARATTLLVTSHFNEGSGFSAKSWRESQVLQYIRDNNLHNCTIFSNGVDALYLFLNMKVEPVPRRSDNNINIDISSLKNNFPPRNGVCIVWFSQITWRSYYYAPDELSSIADLRQVSLLEDGEIYSVFKK